MRQETGLFLPRRGTSIPKVILLVEDDPSNAELFTHILSEKTPTMFTGRGLAGQPGTLLSM